MARSVYGLDLGTYQLKIYDKKENRIRTVKNAVAVRNETEIFATGDRAYEMFEKAPDEITIEFPMKEGVISRIGEMQYLLESELKPEDGFFSKGTEYVIAVPTDVSEMEKKAFFDLVIHSSARAKEVRIVERAAADAVGAGISLKETAGAAIINIGGETTDISVLARGGIVLNRLLKGGGATIDRSIISLVRRQLDFVIGRLTAETVRIKSSVFHSGSNSMVTVAGRDLLRSRPGFRDIPDHIVRTAMKEFLRPCEEAISLMLEQTPPDVLASIRKNGICLTGGIACTEGLDRYLEERLGIPVYTPKDPHLSAIRGVREIIMSEELHDLAYSMKDENYRWMR
nr:rod shape-determining protein [uncultured Sellimonas sp.]